jgi:hypothetical protein
MLASKYALVCKVCSNRYVGTEISNTCSSICHERFIDSKNTILSRGRPKRSSNKSRRKNKLQRLHEIIQRKNKLIRKLKELTKDVRVQAKIKAMPKIDPFYDSKEWRNLRYLVLRKYGRQCMLCSSTDGVMHVDHIKFKLQFREFRARFNMIDVHYSVKTVILESLISMLTTLDRIKRQRLLNKALNKILNKILNNALQCALVIV